MLADMALHRRILEARTRAGLTQDQLGKMVGRSRSAVCSWENPDPDKRETPRLVNLRAIAKNTKVTVSWLLGED
jgi:transcriptional regulator with XRE-family HTH domain